MQTQPAPPKREVSPRPSPVEIWQRLLSRLLDRHYGLTLNDTPFGNDGVIQGRYSNGQTRNLGQIVLVDFTAPTGLVNLGGNQWAETSVSGPPRIGAPGSGSRGVLNSSTIEESNVDLTAELVDMITQQRNYQANAQTIKTQDQVLQTLVNLR